MTGYNVYDFDGTIYNGDSSKDFFWFVLRRHPAALLTVPGFLWYAVLYGLKKCTKERMKEQFFSFVRYVPDIELEVEQFWVRYARKIYPWYTQQVHSSDIIISASPEFLLIPAMSEYHVVATIGTVVDPHNGYFLSPNCYGEEKLRRLRNHIGNVTIECFYSDSKSDQCLAKLSRNPVLVKKGKLIKWDF